MARAWSQDPIRWRACGRVIEKPNQISRFSRIEALRESGQALKGKCAVRAFGRMTDGARSEPPGERADLEAAIALVSYAHISKAVTKPIAHVHHERPRWGGPLRGDLAALGNSAAVRSAPVIA